MKTYTNGKRPEWLKEILATKNEERDILEFNSLKEVKNYCTKNEDFGKGRGKKLSSMKVGEWSGTNTYKEYLEVLDDGDEKVIKKIKVATDLKVAELGKKYEENIIDYKFDVTGQFFDIGLVLTGVPESWLEPEIETVEKVKVDFVINGAFHVKFNKNEIIKASARVIAMAKILEDHDVLVSIKLLSNNEDYDVDRKKTLIIATMLKDYDESINYKKMSALLSPTYHRRFAFKCIEVHSDMNVNGGYGTPRPLKGCIQLNDNDSLDELEHKLFKRK